MQSLKAINLGVRFALELCAIAALAYWGYYTGDSTATRVALGVAAPVAMIVVWGAFVAPRSRFSVPQGVKSVLGLVILLLAAVALADAGSNVLALVLGLASLINAVLLVALD